MYCPGWRSKSPATISKNRLCLRPISTIRRFLLRNAISMPEKNADSVSITAIMMIEFMISAEYIFD